MRRKDREINDQDEIMALIKKCDVCNLAFFDEEYPYVIPLNFGVTLIEGKFTLYFHGAFAGKKLELIKKNNRVGFTMNSSHQLLLGETACESTMFYESVCGNGMVELLGEDEKSAALYHLMGQYSEQKTHQFAEKWVSTMAMLKLSVNEIQGKASKKF